MNAVTVAVAVTHRVSRVACISSLSLSPHSPRSSAPMQSLSLSPSPSLRSSAPMHSLSVDVRAAAAEVAYRGSGEYN